MNDSEFLELLNLYLDHEISAADAARLEAAVQKDPARHRTYLEYCRMQKACTILAKDFVDQSADKKIVAFEPSRSSWGPGLLAAGGLAAAACVALVLANRTPNATNVAPVSSGQQVVVAQPATAKPAEMAAPVPTVVSEKLPASAIAHAVTVPARRADVRPIFASAPLTQTVANSDAAALIAAAQQNVQAQFEWMKAVQLAPMQALPQDDLRLDPRSPLQPASRTYTNGRAVQGEAQMSAFRFQK